MYAEIYIHIRSAWIYKLNPYLTDTKIYMLHHHHIPNCSAMLGHSRHKTNYLSHYSLAKVSLSHEMYQCNMITALALTPKK